MIFLVEVTSLKDKTFCILGFIEAESVSAAIKKLECRPVSGDRFKLPSHVEKDLRKDHLSETPTFRIIHLFRTDHFSDLIIELSKWGYFK